MEQPQLLRKVRLKTVQPQIMCSGRDFIECHYRGRVTKEDKRNYTIEFKYKGKLITELYDKEFGFFKTGLHDIKIVE